MNLILDIDGLKKAHAEFLTQLDSTIETVMKETGEDVKKNIEATTAFKGSILRKMVKVNRVSKYVFQTSMDSKIAVYMNDGTDPHVIAARRTKFLRFTSSGNTIFRRSVNHPGTKATHFFDEANQSAFEKMIINLNARLNALKF